jgi:hypothetical protein
MDVTGQLLPPYALPSEKFPGPRSQSESDGEEENSPYPCHYTDWATLTPYIQWWWTEISMERDVKIKQSNDVVCYHFVLKAFKYCEIWGITAVEIQIQFFWVVAPCSAVGYQKQWRFKSSSSGLWRRVVR